MARRIPLVALAIGSTMGLPFLQLGSPCRSGGRGEGCIVSLFRLLRKISRLLPSSFLTKVDCSWYHHLSWELAVLVLLSRWKFPNQLPLPLRSIGMVSFFCSARYSHYSLVPRKRYRVRMIQWITPLPRPLLRDQFYMCLLSSAGQSRVPDLYTSAIRQGEKYICASVCDEGSYEFHW